MDGFFIDAHHRRVEPFSYRYKDIAPKLGGSMALGHVLRNRDALYVADDGLLKPATRAFRLRTFDDHQPFMSDGVLTGRDNPDADAKIGTLPPTTTQAQLEAAIEWLLVDEALRWFRKRRTEPAVTRQKFGGGDFEVLATWGDMLKNMEGKSGGYHPNNFF